MHRLYDHFQTNPQLKIIHAYKMFKTFASFPRSGRPSKFLPHSQIIQSMGSATKRHLWWGVLVSAEQSKNGNIEFIFIGFTGLIKVL